MPNIYLQHPQHGGKIATSEDEAANDIANGWTVFTPGEVAQSASQPEAETPILNALPVRRGRPRK